MSSAYDAPKPEEFEDAKDRWDPEGHRVDVQFRLVSRPLYPKKHMDTIGPLLPERYAPLQLNGWGLQSVYLAAVPPGLAQELLRLLNQDGIQVAVDPDALSDGLGASTAEIVEAQ